MHPDVIKVIIKIIYKTIKRIKKEFIDDKEK